jgi:hypothetical protein
MHNVNLPPSWLDGKLVWGARAIAAAAGLKDTRQAFYLLEKGLLPGRKVGRQWVSTLDAIRSLGPKVEA